MALPDEEPRLLAGFLFGHRALLVRNACMCIGQRWRACLRRISPWRLMALPAGLFRLALAHLVRRLLTLPTWPCRVLGPASTFIALALVSVPAPPRFVTPFTHADKQVNFNTQPESRFAVFGKRGRLPTRFQGGNRVLARYCALVLFAVSLALVGCSGNYKFNDDEYRPLGDPQAPARSN